MLGESEHSMVRSSGILEMDRVDCCANKEKEMNIKDTSKQLMEYRFFMGDIILDYKKIYTANEGCNHWIFTG